MKKSTGKKNIETVSDEYGMYINACRERKLLKILLIIVVVTFFLLWLSTELLYEWNKWGEAGDFESKNYREPYFRDFLWFVFIISAASFFYTLIVIAIKIGTVNPITMEAYNVRSEDVSKARLFTAMLLAFWILQIVTSGADYFIIYTILFSFTILLLNACHMLWDRNGRKRSILSDFFLFGNDFKRAIIIFTLSLGMLNIFGASFLRWYEEDWAYEYYSEEYNNIVFSNFDLLIAIIRTMGVVLIISAVIAIIVRRSQQARNNT